MVSPLVDFNCCLFLLLVTSASACDRCLHQSKATFTSQMTSSGGGAGACGYGSSNYFKGGLLAGGSPSLFNQGAGCGACFQVRCNNSGFCDSEGVTVTLTDSHGDDNNSFVMSENAFVAMAINGSAEFLLNFGIVEVEYKRVPCEYVNQSLALMVEDHSNRPYYLAVKVLYQGGQTDIVAISVAQEGSSKWAPMRRSYGAVWDTNEMLTGPLNFRFQVNSGTKSKHILAERVLPYDWKNGVIYEAGLQITDIAQETCYTLPCDKGHWSSTSNLF